MSDKESKATAKKLPGVLANIPKTAKAEKLSPPEEISTTGPARKVTAAASKPAGDVESAIAMGNDRVIFCQYFGG
jgi:hypothetical protein